MHNLCPNPRNYFGRSFSHILKYLQTSSFPKYQIVILLTNCYIWGLSVFIWGFKGINVFCIRPCLIVITQPRLAHIPLVDLVVVQLSYSWSKQFCENSLPISSQTCGQFTEHI